MEVFYKRMLFLFIFFPLSMWAQNGVSGIVIDKAGKPVSGVNVKAQGKSSTQTNLEGKFNLNNVKKGDQLIFSHLGFENKRFIYNGQSLLSVEMQDNQNELKEVVVQIGYGTVKKKDVTGSLTTIKTDPINKGLQVTVQDALVGKVAGVNIVPGDGSPGSAGKIRIRSGASLSANNDPLIIIDGVPSESNSLGFINPNDIDTYTVLKDASATAIYGSRASNGVIIVTTKKGSATGGMRINYSVNTTVSYVRSYYDVLGADQYREAFSKYAIGVPDNFKLGTANTDWQKEIYRSALGYDHNLSFTGNIKKTPYRISGGYLNQNGVLIENNYERFTGALGLSPKFFDKHLSVDVNVKISSEDEKPASTENISNAIGFDPTRPVHADYPNKMGLGYYMWLNSQGKPISLSPVNPVSDLELTNKKNKTKRSIGNVVLDYKIHDFEDLHLNVNLGYDVLNKKYQEITPDKAPSMYTSNNKDGTGKIYEYDYSIKNYILTMFANYNKDISKKQNINAMVGYEWQKFWYDINDNMVKGNQNIATSPPSLGDGFSIASIPDTDALYLLSFFGRANYSYDNKLLLTGTLRADASSRFAPKNQWGYFPSLALGYKLTEEKFFKDIKELSNLKLRLSYGQTGQQDIGNYHPYLPTYTISRDNARYKFGDTWINMYRPNGYSPNIKWETTTTYNFGIDYGFLDNRIYGSIDIYKRKTKDLLNNIAMAAGSNFIYMLKTNIGDMKGKGAELAINLVPVRNKEIGLEWTVTGNFTYSKSEITKLNTIDQDFSYVKTGGIDRNDFQIQKVEQTPNTFFLLHQAYDNNGKPLDGKYIGKNGNITTSNADSEKYITGKSSRVPYYYGFSTKVLYKQWDLGINSHGSFGNYVFNYQEAKQSLNNLYSSDRISGNISQATLDKGFTQARFFSDIFLENAAFYKIDNITAGYTFDRLGKSIKSLRLAFSLQNIATFTGYSGVDPEIYDGLDNKTYQRPKTYTLSLNMNF